MRKQGISIGIISAIVLVIVVIAIQIDRSESQSSDFESKMNNHEVVVEADIIMPTKVSRPGCEQTNACYIPSVISITAGETVIWSNEDGAFHSVTSGFYENPTNLFDSGHLDPGEKFSVTFEEEGVYDFFCTLHPWMEGKVLVE